MSLINKAVEALIQGLDQSAVARAVKAGNITAPQGRFAVAAIEVRKNPIQTQLVCDDEGDFIGEITPLQSGQWRAVRYGREYREGGVTVATAENGIRYLRERTP